MQNALIVDDHPVARMAVKMLLEKDGMNVVAETGDGLDAVSLIKQYLPDLVVIDIDIPSMNGIEVVQRLRNNGYQGGMLVLSGKDDDHYIKRCASAGADGFISKKNQLTELHAAIQALKGGYGYFPRHLARREVAADHSTGEKDKLAMLSTKELQVLHHLAKGEKVIDIGVLMNISDKTVSTYKRRLMQKLGLNNMMELYDFVQRNNLD
ncbi:response regulator [Acinetobacter calcoaceticus]|uniref:response regulator n=1 Tax=Acinetobacter calcoaceticus TaxID=471 RepID=UPI00192AD14E|nr:response regulator [Acinetobacter calcoaceticus]